MNDNPPERPEVPHNLPPLEGEFAELERLRQLAESNGVLAHAAQCEEVRLRKAIREALKCSDLAGARSFLNDALASTPPRDLGESQIEPKA